MKVLGIGEIVMDNVYHVKDVSKNYDEQDSHHIKRCMGGPVPMALILLSRLGVDCTFIGSIGTDEQGHSIRRELSRDRINLIAHHQPTTKSNIILVDERSGNRKKIRGSVTHAPIENIDADMLKSFDVIIIDRHEKEAFYEVVKNKAPHARIVIDPSTEVSDFTLDMIRLADHPILPIESVMKIEAGESIMEKMKVLHTMSGKDIVITAGELGTILYDGVNIEIIPSMDIKPVDTNGAGDVFRAAIVYGILRKWNIRKSIKMGNVVAALQCMKVGNSTAIPTKKEIIRSAKTLKEKKIQLSHVEDYCEELM